MDNVNLRWVVASAYLFFGLACAASAPRMGPDAGCADDCPQPGPEDAGDGGCTGRCDGGGSAPADSGCGADCSVGPAAAADGAGGCVEGCGNEPEKAAGPLVLEEVMGLDELGVVTDLVVTRAGLWLVDAEGHLALLSQASLERFGAPAPQARLMAIGRSATAQVLGCFGVERQAFVARLVAGRFEATAVGGYDNPCVGRDIEHACWGGRVDDCTVREDAAGRLHGLFISTFYADGEGAVFADLGREDRPTLQRYRSQVPGRGAWGFFWDGRASILVPDAHGLASYGASDVQDEPAYVWRRTVPYGEAGDGTQLSGFDIQRKTINGKQRTGLAWAEFADGSTSLYFAEIMDGQAQGRRLLAVLEGQSGSPTLVLNREGRPIVALVTGWEPGGGDFPTWTKAHLLFDDEQQFLVEEDFSQGPVAQAQLLLDIDEQDEVHLIVNRTQTTVEGRTSMVQRQVIYRRYRQR